MEFEKIIRLVEVVSASALTGFTLEENGTRLVLEKKPETGASPEGISVVKSVPIMQAELPVMQTADAGAFPAAGTGLAAEQPQSSAASSIGEAEAGSGTALEEKIVKAPLVGTFYAAPSEEAEPFVAVGDVVKKGQVLGIIEAMKLMNEIESEYDGVVEAILISNEQVVEYGQPLFRIRRKG
ncbi:MAG: acetyl-CoA carboxylase biotin carboxyl carrier protein [Lachnospiraceae bacterium]|jgi:acetyl-CoA carboxylase biotin carboxyl carrier protein|nr:acetyl-CoA carboxylase biotin carboxyl carrier protein [Lachnospiraceae bacterium]